MSIHFLPSATDLPSAIASLKKHARSQSSLGIEIDEIDDLKFEKLELPFPYFFWKSRDTETRFHAWGISESYASFDSCPQTEFPRFASVGFSTNTNKTDLWSNFSDQLIWKPQWCLKLGKKNILYHSPKQLDTPIEQRINAFTPRQEIPNQEGWTNNIHLAKRLFSDTSLEKIVLARQSNRWLQDPYAVFYELQSIQKHCYHFLFSPNHSEAFFGVSPERLLHIKDHLLQTEALAGTRERLSHSVENKKLSEELFRSSKDRYEHGVVVDYICKVLQPFSNQITIEKQQILSLRHVQHLQTPINALIAQGYSLDSLVRSLHPTPAVCGLPKQVAKQYILELEDFDRGLYAGTIGLITDNKIDFTVSIRSALWQNNQLFVWAGAGIVPESDPMQEWIELDNKSKQFIERSEERLYS